MLSSTTTSGNFSFSLNSSTVGRFNSQSFNFLFISIDNWTPLNIGLSNENCKFTDCKLTQTFSFWRKQRQKKKPAETPLMKQYNQIKSKHPTAMLLFRVGDFYELFGEDAIKASRILGIVLTKRKNGTAAHIELAGFPHHSLQTYLPKLVRAG